MDVTIASVIGVVIGAIISGFTQWITLRANNKFSIRKSLNARLLDECLSLVDSVVDLINSVQSFAHSVIPSDMDRESEPAKEIDRQGADALDSLFEAQDQALRVVCKIEVIGGKKSSPVAKAIQETIIDYLKRVEKNEFRFVAADHNDVLNQLISLRGELLQAIRDDLEIEKYRK